MYIMTVPAGTPYPDEDDFVSPPVFDAAEPPDDPGMRRVYDAAKQLVELDASLTFAQAAVERLKASRRELATRTLPALLDTAGVDRLGLPGAGVDVVVETHYHAAIRTGSPPEEREAAFDHLEALGGGDLVRATVEISFPREQLPLARHFLERAKADLHHIGKGSSARLVLGVPWASLTGWLRSELGRARPPGDNRPPVNLPLLGATVERRARVVPRQD